MKSIHKFLIAFSILLFMLVAWINAGAQEVKLKNTHPFTFTTEQEAVGKAARTTFFVYIKGRKYDLYSTDRGAHYYIIQNKKGDWTRKYVKTEN